MQSNTTEETNNENDKFLGKWPYRFNSAFAYLGCTIGILNIDRFSIYSVQYGANFIIQFLIMSLIFGIPLFTLQVCLGRGFKAGILQIWKISPIFQGLGVALLLVHIYIGIYNIIGVSWLLVYFRDSFISNHETYPWAKEFMLNRNVLYNKDLNQEDFSATILRFQIAFNLAVLWIVIFFSLSKGLHSYGKVIIYYISISLLCNFLVCIKVLNLIPQDSSDKSYSTDIWSGFFFNYQSWIAATTEAFLTWGLLGAATMQIAVHNRDKSFVKRDILFVVLFTMLMLFLNAFIANNCVKVLNLYGYNFIKADGEKINDIIVKNTNYASSNTSRTSFLLEKIFQSNKNSIKKSSNHVLKYSTELVPLTIAFLGNQYFTPFWTISFYFALILIGLSQQLAIWNCVIMNISSVIKKKNKSFNIQLVFLSCLCGFCLGIMMTTELGNNSVYYLENVIDKSWWVIILYLMQCGVVFLVRRDLCNVLLSTVIFSSTNKCFQNFIGSVLTFSWNIILPTVLMVLSIVIFKSNGLGEHYLNQKIYKSYWTVWAKEIGITIQLLPLLIVAGVAIIQIGRYLYSGPPSICKRLQLLCRPPLEFDFDNNVEDCESNEVTSNIRENEGFQSVTNLIVEDSPPKYTPPPSYSTATGERMAKFLRRSFRKSIRSIGKILRESNDSNPKSTSNSSQAENKI
ncbi:sodium-dependent transporter bedraggled isoform X2 [Leptopilina boulardi]|uniref:sodium-dependent transporter bedraggled isoform X2 n=1 Tax=Leptopilina boulardi TaxID=63433 RepID=UPI0021F606F7|nr:sodium-dependent transporter bedraggled isoform X2 [Leptopilina boulardi]